MSFSEAPKIILKTVLFALAILVVSTSARAETRIPAAEGRGFLGVIKGTVRDDSGNPIANAYVSFFRVGTSELLKQVKSGSNGSFLAKVLPGTYTVLAIAEGFNPVTYRTVEINRSAELNYKFNLERSGGGNTLPEKRLDRNSSKWRIRAAQISASIYQSTEGKSPIDENAVGSEDEPAEIESDDDVAGGKRRGQTVVETFAAGNGGETFGGVNFATLLPAGERTDVIIAGQTALSANAPQRLEVTIGTQLKPEHLLRINAAAAKAGRVTIAGRERELGQVSVQATDEWRVRDNVVVVLGFDYSRFVGAGRESSLTPRLGLQYDINARTRLKTAYTTQNEEKTWSQAVEMEGTTVAFREPVSTQAFVVRNDRPLMNRSSRFEFGVERVLDSRSTIEANVFFDLTNGRGVGLINMPIGFLSDEGGKMVAEQQGRSQGVRVVYTRRLNGIVSTSAGYSAGNGQKLSSGALTNPSEVFVNDYFQTFFGQVDAALRSGTQVKTVFRLSPQATVFSIDPFKGRMTIYDPGLSVVVTQSLPTLGLPIRAEAILDARNLFDFQNGVNTDEGSLKLATQGRMVRGGIMVRF